MFERSLELYRVAGDAKKNFYYDCLDDLRKGNESEEDFQQRLSAQEAIFKQFRRQPSCHVRLGSIQGERPRQKEVDVLIAVDMLTQAARGNFQKVILMTGDLDFRPLIESLVGFGIDVTLAAFNRASEKLIEAADNFEEYSANDIFKWINSSHRENMNLPKRMQSDNPPPLASCNSSEDWSIIFDDQVTNQYIAYKQHRDGYLWVHHEDQIFLEAYIEVCC